MAKYGYVNEPLALPGRMKGEWGDGARSARGGGAAIPPIKMIKVKIGELRNHLSHYLKKVRHGAEITITDRETPIGRLLPYSPPKEEKFEIIEPPDGYEGFAKLDFPDMNIKVDPVEVLLQDRQKR